MRRLHQRIRFHFLMFLAVLAAAASAFVSLGGRAGHHPVLWILIIMMATGIVTAPLARRISRPIERLTEASRRFGAGDLSVRVPVADRCAPRGGSSGSARRGGSSGFARRGARARPGGGPVDDELAELSRAWNDMAARVESLVRGQKELLANVSHELRSPLARVRVALELLPRDAEGERRIADIEADLVELDRLIEDVLTTSRLEATGLPTHLEPVELGALLGQLVERAGDHPTTRGQAVSVEPGAAPELVADTALIRRALWNLVENAGKYGAPPITLAARAVGERVELSVGDHGPGIPAAERERVTEPFYQADKARTPGQARGFGLGLTLARKVAEVHGGELTVADGADGAGCRVTLSIPAKPAAI